MERQHSSLSEEKRRRNNERSRAKRASETENEKRQRCDKRNAADRARRSKQSSSQPQNDNSLKRMLQHISRKGRDWLLRALKIN